MTAEVVEVRSRGKALPIALAKLHRSLHVGAPLTVSAPWPHGPVTPTDLLIGAGFAVNGHTDRATFGVSRERSLPDTVGAGLRLLVSGLNPSAHAADAGLGYVTPGNRFWPAALAAGLVSVDRDPWHALRHHRLGMTDVVKRATPRADALTNQEYCDGIARLERLCAWLQPGVMVFVGLAGWRAAVDRGAVAGLQAQALGGRPVYVLPSTSGLNAGTPFSTIVDHLRSADRVAGGA